MKGPKIVKYYSCEHCDDTFVRFDEKNIKYISIKKIDKQLNDLKGYNAILSNRIIEAFDKIKQNTIRKTKLQKIENENRPKNR